MAYPLARCPRNHRLARAGADGYLDIRFQSGWVGFTPHEDYEDTAATALAAWCQGCRRNYFLKFPELVAVLNGKSETVVARRELRFRANN